MNFLQIGAISTLILIGASTGSFAIGYERGKFQALLAAEKAQTAVVVKAALEARALGIAEGNITFTAGAHFADVQTKIVRQTVALLPEIPVVYVTPRANRAYPINLGIVRVLNIAASGDDPATAFPLSAGQSDDDTATTDLASLAANVASNYGTCGQTRAQLVEVLAWVRQQQALRH